MELRSASIRRTAARWALFAIGSALALPGASAHAIGPYLMGSRSREIGLARSAAPAAIANRAAVMVLGSHGYFTAAKGTNGFVCLVVRSWDHSLDANSASFWDPKFRAPFCLNAAARSVLQHYLLRTRWVIAGESRRQISARDNTEWATGRFQQPQPGALCYMMSRRGNLGDGPWYPHVMFYLPHARASSWGANLHGVPIVASTGRHTTIFMVLVPTWSDGTPAPAYP